MKGQVSVEYMLVIALVMMVLVPASYLFITYSERSTTQLNEAQVQKVGGTLVNNAEKVYYMSSPARLTVKEQFPSSIVNISTNIDWDENVNEVVFYMSSGEWDAQYVFTSNVNFNTSFSDEAYSAGLKTLYMEAYQTDANIPFVLINLAGRCPISTDYDLNNDDLIDCLDKDIFDTCVDVIRPTDLWDDAWYTCIQTDYDGNCVITNTPNGDLDILQTQTGVCP